MSNLIDLNETRRFNRCRDVARRNDWRIEKFTVDDELDGQLYQIVVRKGVLSGGGSGFRLSDLEYMLLGVPYAATP